VGGADGAYGRGSGSSLRSHPPLTPPFQGGEHAGRFAESAARLAGLAGAWLGWRADEFWGATPAELAAVLSAFAGEPEEAASAEDLARLMERFPDG